MRLELILPRGNAMEFEKLLVCPHQDCQGRHFEHHQEVDKPLKDTKYRAVSAHRYRCLRCRRTFRVYPLGVTRAQTSQRVKGLAVMLYLLGLSYGATSLALEALGVYMSKSSVYEAVQAAAEKVPGMKRREVFAGLQTPAMGGDTDLIQAKKRIGHRVCMIGGFDQFHFFTNCTPDETRHEVRRCFEEAGEGGGYILSPSDHFFKADTKCLQAYADEARQCVYP